MEHWVPRSGNHDLATHTRVAVSMPARIVDGDFAGWLRDAMAERGVTTRVLAMRTGIDHTTISRLRRGANAPTLSTAVALLRVLGSRPMTGRR